MSVTFVVQTIGPLQRFVNWVENIEWPQRPEPNEDDWINKPTTSLGFGAIILLNSVFMAIETELRGEPKRVWIVIECVFIVIFSVEILLRLKSERKYYFLDAWNWLDVCVVAFGILGTGMDISTEMLGPSAVGSEQDLSLGTILRVFRLMKLVRIIKLIRFFSELALLIQGVINSMKTLLWVLVFLALVTMIFSIIFTKLLGQKRSVIEMASIGDCADEHFRTKNLWRANLPPEHFDKYDERQTDAACQLLEWFGSVYLSSLSLFMSATLEQWPAMCRLSTNAEAGGSAGYVLLWLLYIYFTNITLLNLITGVIVETVLQLARTDEIDAIEAQRKEKETIRKHMIAIFKQADDDGNEEVTRFEFAESLKKPEVLEHMSVLEINPLDAYDLFDIVDVDQSNSISIFEFMDGFGRLKGPALAKHLLKVQCDAQRLYKNALEGIDEANATLREQMSKLKRMTHGQCNTWERKLQKVFCPDTVPWVEDVDCAGAEAVFQSLREEVATLSALSPELQEALKSAGADLVSAATQRSEEVNVHARAFGATLSALQMQIGLDEM
jgi:hypothetical protein